MRSPFHRIACAVFPALLILSSGSAVEAAGRIAPPTIRAIHLGTFNGLDYIRYQAMFDGATSRARYRVPCEIVAPAPWERGSGLALFDWTNRTAIFTAAGQELALGRYALTDDFLFGQGIAFATVRSDPIAIGLPWMDGTLDTSSEFIVYEADEFDIVADFVRALRDDPKAVSLIGPIRRQAGIGYSSSGGRLRGLLRIPLGDGLFDFSLVGGSGSGFLFPDGEILDFTELEVPPRFQAGLEIDFNTETDVLISGAADARFETGRYRSYEFAGASHLRREDAFAFGFTDPESANPADWFPLLRALFVAGDGWCDGVQPPPSIWLGAPGNARISRDHRRNALVQFVGGSPVDTTEYRLPEVAVGENRYIAFDPAYQNNDFLRALAGKAVDLTHTFDDHDDYVQRIASHADQLLQQGLLLDLDAAAIILEAEESDIGNP